jgi:hypothetical protein
LCARLWLAKCEKLATCEAKIPCADKKAEATRYLETSNEKREKPGREKLLKHLAHIFKRKVLSTLEEEAKSGIHRNCQNIKKLNSVAFCKTFHNSVFVVEYFLSHLHILIRNRASSFCAFVLWPKAFSTVFEIDNSFKLLSRTETFNYAQKCYQDRLVRTSPAALE